MGETRSIEFRLPILCLATNNIGDEGLKSLSKGLMEKPKTPKFK